MSLDSFFSVLAVTEGRFDRTRKVDRRQQVNSPRHSEGMILRTDGRLSMCNQRTASLASTVHVIEIVLLSLSSASPFRPSRSLFAFAYGVLLFSCHCFIKDAQFSTQGGIIGFVFTVRGLDNWQPRPERRSRRRKSRRLRSAQPLRDRKSTRLNSSH